MRKAEVYTRNQAARATSSGTPVTKVLCISRCRMRVGSARAARPSRAVHPEQLYLHEAMSRVSVY